MKAATRIIVIEILAVLVAATAYGSTPFVPNDPYFYTGMPTGFSGQWYLDKQTSGASIDANVRGAWDRGLSGEGVIIGIVDDGVSLLSHPDLSPNARADLSWDFVTNAPPTSGGSHGTAVAGIAAARGGNSLGGSGAAPKASLTVLKIPFQSYPSLYYETADTWCANAALYEDADIAIKNHSYQLITYPWIDYPLYRGALRQSSLDGTINVVGAMNNRALHGQTYSIFFNTHVALDADVNKYPGRNIPEVILVAAAGSDGHFSNYSNFGANIFVTAPSSTSGGLEIITTDSPGEFGYNNSTGDAQYNSGVEDQFPDLDYASRFGGTSAATPVVSGILALAKEAQPKLDTRFAKHLLANTSRLIDSNDASPMGGWITNGAGHHFNNNYGFGLIDANALTIEATKYSAVTPLTQVSTGNTTVNEVVPTNGVNGVSKSFIVQEAGPLEEVVVNLAVGSSYDPGGNFSRGDVEATLTSPLGTTSLLLYRNPRDFWEGPLNWSFTSNAFWGESPMGEWTLTVRDVNAGNDGDQDARDTFWQSFSVTLRSGSLIPAGLGDFDADGDVDGNDYVRWRRDFGSTTSLAADDSGNGIVDAADYVIWRSNLGMGAATLNAAVPEPAVVLNVFMISLVFFRHRKKAASS